MFHTARFKATVVIKAIIAGDVRAVAKEYDVEPCDVSSWRADLMAGARGVF